jgi:hypothetical protein
MRAILIALSICLTLWAACTTAQVSLMDPDPDFAVGIEPYPWSNQLFPSKFHLVDIAKDSSSSLRFVRRDAAIGSDVIFTRKTFDRRAGFTCDAFGACTPSNDPNQLSYFMYATSAARL